MDSWPYPRWIAHRGAGKLAPENTLAAFRLGAEHGYRMFECDAKLSSDGIVFLMHDATLDRTTDGRGPVARKTLAELKRLDAGAWFDRRYAGERVPTLREFLAACKGRIRPMLDLQDSSETYLRQIAREVRDHGEPAQTVLGVRTLEQAKLLGKLLPEATQIGLIPTLDSIEDFARAVNEFRRVAAANARKSEQYMAHNRTQPGVVQLASGVQYAVIKQGQGTVSPTVDSKVTVNYRGMLIDGTEFDSTFAHGNPVSFVVKSVIPGWRDVIPRMHVGDRWKVVIPPRLAYGERGALPRIGPNEALVFDIELLDIANP